jgi:biopolymer transport protein ExbB
MFAGKTLWEVLSMGGFTMYVLLLCSLASVTVIIERLWTYRSRSRVDRRLFMAELRGLLGDRDKAIEHCRAATAPFAQVVLAGLAVKTTDAKLLSNAMERQVAVESGELAKLTGVVGTIGNIAVYIGLFGTVLGIIRAFHDISSLGAGGMEVIIGGVAEALITTAAGLAVAVPAVIAYNYFVGRIDRFVSDMELCASELTDVLSR